MVKRAIKKDSSHPELIKPKRNPFKNKLKIFKKNFKRFNTVSTNKGSPSANGRTSNKPKSKFNQAAFQLLSFTLEAIKTKKEKEQKLLTEEEKKNEILKLVNYISTITDKEIDRINNLYLTKIDFTVENVLNIYKIFLVLLGNRQANKCVLNFLKKKNVR